MRTLIPAALILSTLLSPVAATAATADVTGRWRVLEPVAATQDVTWLELSQEDGRLVGILADGSGRRPVAGRADASGQLSLQVADGRLISLKQQGSGLRGTIRAPGSTGAEVRAVRGDADPVAVAPVAVAGR
ncbi:MAG TPA: hypothetical protein VEB20_08045 [Azospirillaceae bacterium]|nr:hypothetical protein [Azospirillaceae bacterium]